MIFAPLLSLALMMLGSGFFMSFISLHLKALGAASLEIGLTQSVFYLGLLVSSLRSEKLIGRIGHIRSLTAMCGLMAGSIACLFFVSKGYWYPIRFLAGLCVGGFYVAVESWLMAEFPSSRRGYALSLYTAVLYLGQSLSQIFLKVTHENAAAAFLIAAGFSAAAVVPVSLGKSSGPAPVVAEPESILKFLKLSPLGVLGSMMAGVILSTLYSFMPLYLEQQNLDPSLLMTTMILGGALMQYPIGKMSDRTDRRLVLIGLGIIGTLLSFVLLIGSYAPFVFVTLFLLGGAFFTIYPVSMALGCDCVDDNDLVKMTGVLLFAYGVGAVVGPLITPLLSGVSKNYAILMTGAYGLLVVIIGTYAFRTRKPVIASDKSSFDLVPTGPVLEKLNPYTPSPPEQNKKSV